MKMPTLEAKQVAIRRNVLVTFWGVIIGLFFGVPPAWGAHDIGLPWAPYGIAVIVMSLVAGLLIAFTVDILIPRGRTSSGHHPPASNRSNPIRERLAEEKACLDRMDARHEYRAGERIVWNELLDLELQDIDEQVKRICSDKSLESDKLRHQGGSS
jgi:hypothetical protein